MKEKEATKQELAKFYISLKDDQEWQEIEDARRKADYENLMQYWSNDATIQGILTETMEIMNDRKNVRNELIEILEEEYQKTLREIDEEEQLKYEEQIELDEATEGEEE